MSENINAAETPSVPYPLGTENYTLTPEEQAAFDAEPDIKIVSFRNNNQMFPLTHKRRPNSLYESYPGSPPALVVDRTPKQPESLLHQAARLVFCYVTVHNICFIFFLLGLTALAVAFLPGWWGTIASAAFWAWYIPQLMDRESGQQSIRPSIWPALQEFWGWNYTHEWGRVQVARLAKLDPRRQYMFGFYPHGILIHSRLSMWGGLWKELFPGLQIPRIFAASVLFSIPGSRELCLWLGAIDARRSSAHRCMQQGLTAAVYPGGTAEILTTDPESPNTTLLSRSGFVRLAIQYGVPIVPVFTFGEKYMYNRVRLPRWLDKLVYLVFRMPMIFFSGFLGTWVPLPRELTVIYGAPIEVTRNEDPSVEEVAMVLDKFMAAERAIFDTFRDQIGYAENEKLVIVDAKKVTGVKKGSKGGREGGGLTPMSTRSSASGAAGAGGSPMAMNSPSTAAATATAAAAAAAAAGGSGRGKDEGSARDGLSPMASSATGTWARAGAGAGTGAGVGAEAEEKSDTSFDSRPAAAAAAAARLRERVGAGAGAGAGAETHAQ